MFMRQQSLQDVDISLMERWRVVAPADRMRLSHNLARGVQADEPTDPFVYQRVYSRLMNNVEHPCEYGYNERLLRELPKVKTVQ